MMRDVADLLAPTGDVAGKRVLWLGADTAAAEQWRAAGAELTVAEKTPLPFPGSAFDVALASDLGPDPRRAASELLRVLRPGGRFAVVLRHRTLLSRLWPSATPGFTIDQALVLFAGTDARATIADRRRALLVVTGTKPGGW